MELNKETMARLDNMNEIRGGGVVTDNSCQSCTGGTCGTDSACPTCVGATCNGGASCPACPASIVICIG